MADTKETKTGYLKPKKLTFPDDVLKHSWLSILLEAYYIVDEGIAAAIKMENKKGRKLACEKGCSGCCRTHRTIPVYPLELAGISWYVTEKISGAEREILKNQLLNHNENSPCPFLINGSCSIHPVRPISCRQFIVFNKPCSDGEDPFYTRREDVLTPLKKYVDKAFYIMLPFYGVNSKSERLKLIKSGAVHNLVKLIQTCNWKSLSDKMEDFDRGIGYGRGERI